MSKIHENICRARSLGVLMSIDDIINHYTVNDIKEYIIYLQNEIKHKDEQIKELIIENVTLEVKGSK